MIAKEGATFIEQRMKHQHVMSNVESLKKKYKALIRTAEMSYRLAHAVRIECSQQGSSSFPYPQVYTYGKHTVVSDEFSLNAEQENFASSALLHSAVYLIAVQMDKALQEVVGSGRFAHEDQNIRSASCIARTIRNAFAHDPFNPIWCIKQSECKNKIFEIRDIIRLDTNNLSDKKVEPRHYGGPLALFQLAMFVRTNILK